MLDEKLKHEISLLVDDRLDPAAAMKLARSVEFDPEAAAVYSRFLLAGEVIRSRSAVIHDPGFVDRVHRTLAEEPTLLAPVRKRAVRDRLVTTALAATLAGVAVLVGESVFRQSNLAVTQSAQQARMTETTSNSLQSYLVNHNGTAYLAANGSLLPYLRVVSQASPKR